MEHKTLNIVKSKIFLIKPKQSKKYIYKAANTYFGNNVYHQL